jgi:hypothetical protein
VAVRPTTASTAHVGGRTAENCSPNRWSRPEGMVCVGRGRIDVRWISHLAWSDWEPAADDSGAQGLARRTATVADPDLASHHVDTVQAALAYSTPTGVVKVLIVKQLASGFVEVDEPQTVAEPDDRPLTALSWLGGSLLSWTKPGEVILQHVSGLPSSKGKRKGKGQASSGSTVEVGSWHGSGRWRLKRFGSWADSSRLATCSGRSRGRLSSTLRCLADPHGNSLQASVGSARIPFASRSQTARITSSACRRTRPTSPTPRTTYRSRAT